MLSRRIASFYLKRHYAGPELFTFFNRLFYLIYLKLTSVAESGFAFVGFLGFFSVHIIFACIPLCLCNCWFCEGFSVFFPRGGGHKVHHLGKYIFNTFRALNQHVSFFNGWVFVLIFSRRTSSTSINKQYWNWCTSWMVRWVMDGRHLFTVIL